MNSPRTLSLLIALVAMGRFVMATEYFVSRGGDDAHAGTGSDSALATIQKGVDLLQPGDILTIAPGEYAEAITRTGLGGMEKETIIRADIPGTVLLRGDVPAPEFRPLAGHRFVYEADFDFASEVPVVNEVDTLTILNRMPNSAEPEFIPGTFFHDAAAKRLYLSTSDMQPVERHHYTVSVRPTHGLYFLKPQRVTIEGLAFTGFSALGLHHYREGAGGGVWGMFLYNGRQCVIRDCRAYLNAWGIGLSSAEFGSGENVIERCEAWGNSSVFVNGDMGGLTIFSARRDAIRNSTSFRNGMYGVNIYGTGGAPPGADDGGNDPAKRSFLTGNLAWGNQTADIKIKTGYEYHHVAENCVGLGIWSTTHALHGLLVRGAARDKEHSRDNIEIEGLSGFDPQLEFADPVHHDYRLQSTSRFRGKAADGGDLGPFPYAANIFYVKPEGDDKADGLSVATAWKTVARATTQLRAGDTLYLEGGDGFLYAASDFKLAGLPDAPISICRRGEMHVGLVGPTRLSQCRDVRFSRIAFDEMQVAEGNSLEFDRCDFTSLDAAKVSGLKITHCAFNSFEHAALSARDCSQMELIANLFWTGKAPALRLPASAVRYANNNGYTNLANAWEGLTWEDVQKTQEQQSFSFTPILTTIPFGQLEMLALGGVPAKGPFGKPAGPYEDTPRQSVLQLAVKPTVHSVSATTANVEWYTSAPATCELAWGETPACEHTASFDVSGFATYSLTELKPGQKYFFRLKSMATPKPMVPKVEAQTVEVKDEPISFTTLERNSAPVTYHVATNGDDARSGLDPQNAWRTIRHAADTVNAGDTVLVAAGQYAECVRVRATGDAGSPITFRARPGERVELDGSAMLLNSAFVAGGKSHLRFDGFYFANFNLFPNDGWSLTNSGEFHLYACHDIEISRCFSDGRGGYTAIPVNALEVENLTIRNCVNTNKFGGMYFWHCPDLLIENTVFAAPMIMSFVLRNEKTQKATMTNCIFTDMFEKKAKLNIGLLCCDGPDDAFRQRNNAYLLRCFPPETRALNGDKPIGQLGHIISEPLFADPLFAGDPGAKGHPEDKSGYAPDRLMDPALKLDFAAFFATNPELIKRGIGLQREAFQDYR